MDIDSNLEKDLANVDFSKHSKIRKKLLNDLLNQRRKKSDDENLDLDELDMISAAGNVFLNKQSEKNS